ncbi:MAG: DivIVA domain-containing protein [Ruminiclostridium sp.]|nr:DivIVA domain-containing protein [Ruminiclostridium sp.]
MEANTIRDKKFLEVMRGYKKEDVDEFLSEVASEFSKLRKANEELEKKLEVLADKIREYREDEDALKEALLGAQKQGRMVVDEAKEKAANIVMDAQNKSDEMIKEAEDVVAQKKEEGEKAIADALAEKQRIEEEAAKKAADLHQEMEIQHEIDKEALARTRREAEDFRIKLIAEYTNHIEFIKKLPEMCQNEYVKETVDNHDTAVLRDLLAQQRGEEVITADVEEKPEETDDDVKIVSDFNEIPVQEAESEEITETNESDDEGGFTVENAFSDDDEEEDNTPDFLKNKHKNNKSKFEKLEFGNNTSGSNGKNKKKR